MGVVVLTAGCLFDTGGWDEATKPDGHNTESSGDPTTDPTDDPVPTTGTATDDDDEPPPESTTTGAQPPDPTDPPTPPDPRDPPEPQRPVCGDGEVNTPEEECDLGVGINNNNGACTLLCKQAYCGDGLVWEAKEACDEGQNNNQTKYNGCKPNCTLGPRCGDGIVQPNGGEECDHGEANGSGMARAEGVSCSDGCRFEAKLVFLSSQTFTGQLGGADQRCAKAAAAAALDNHNKFRAWLSSPTSTPATTFTPHTQPLVLRNGRRVADNLAQLFETGPITGITHTETGQDLLHRYVWTGTGPDGNLANPPAHCNGWTTQADTSTGQIGYSGVDEDDLLAWAAWHVHKLWTKYTTEACDKPRHLYCIED